MSLLEMIGVEKFEERGPSFHFHFFCFVFIFILWNDGICFIVVDFDTSTTDTIRSPNAERSFCGEREKVEKK